MRRGCREAWWSALSVQAPWTPAAMLLSVITKQSQSLSNCARMSTALGRRWYASANSRVVELHTDDEWVQAINKAAETKSAAVVEFTARWCGPCKVGEAELEH